MIDLSGWLTTAEVCARLGIGERTLEREGRAGKWQSRMRNRPGKRPERVYDPQQVADREQKPPTELVRNGPIAPALPTIPPLATPLTLSSEWQAWHVLGPRLLDALVAQKPPATPTLFCSIDEAVQVTGLTRAYLKRLIAQRVLPSNRGGPHGATRIRRGDLEELGCLGAGIGDRKARA